jgi:hypothetical protein
MVSVIHDTVLKCGFSFVRRRRVLDHAPSVSITTSKSSSFSIASPFSLSGRIEKRSRNRPPFPSDLSHIIVSGLVGDWVALIVLRYGDAVKCVLADLRVPRNCLENLCEPNGEESLLTMEEERYLYLTAMFGLCASGSKGWNYLLLRLRAGDF